MTSQTLQDNRKDAEKLIVEILKQLRPESKQRALDIITGFSLADKNPKMT